MINPGLNNSPAWRKIMAFYRTLKPGLWLMRTPLLGPLLQKVWLKPGEETNWFIPNIKMLEIGEEITTGRQVVLPGLVVENLFGEADGIFAMAARLSAGIGCKFLLPDYRLAPEHPFPAAIEDVISAYR